MLKPAQSPGSVSNTDTKSSPQWWLQLVDIYDKWYHRLKQHSPWVVTLVLCCIITCSVAIGWSFRLKTFNIADKSSIDDSVVSAIIVYYCCGETANDGVRHCCALGPAVREPCRYRPIWPDDDARLDHQLRLRADRLP